jgi:hypothetical protein
LNPKSPLFTSRSLPAAPYQPLLTSRFLPAFFTNRNYVLHFAYPTILLVGQNKLG